MNEIRPEAITFASSVHHRSPVVDDVAGRDRERNPCGASVRGAGHTRGRAASSMCAVLRSVLDRGGTASAGCDGDASG